MKLYSDERKISFSIADKIMIIRKARDSGKEVYLCPITEIGGEFRLATSPKQKSCGRVDIIEMYNTFKEIEPWLFSGSNEIDREKLILHLTPLLHNYAQISEPIEEMYAASPEYFYEIAMHSKEYNSGLLCDGHLLYDIAVKRIFGVLLAGESNDAIRTQIEDILYAYGTALSIKLLHMPFFPACLMGILAAMLAGGLIGRATLRLKGDYFVIATLAIGECTKLLIENIPSITGGSRGLTDIPKKTSLLLVWVILLAVIVILSNFLHSKHGRNCIAVREEELAAKSIGIDVIRYKMLAFLISCALCGLAGGLLAGYMGYLYPTMFTMAKSNELTMTVILGGTGSLTGTILAGLVLIPLPEYLRIESAEEWRMVLYGVLVVAVIVFKPSGLMGSKEFTVAGVLRRCKQLAARVRKRGSKRDKEGEAKK